MTRLVVIAIAFAGCTHSSAISQPVSTPSPITVLHSLTSDDGVNPRAGVTLGPDGKLWGSSWQRGPRRFDPTGGVCSSTDSWSTDYQARMCPGSVWRLNSDGTGFEVVHGFTQLDTAYRNEDGYQPSSAPIDGGDGGMWGTTSKGGEQTLSTGRGGGVVYRIDLATGAFEVVHSFPSLPSQIDGAYLYAGLAADRRGHLFGSGKAGGASGAGAVFEIDVASREVVPLHSYGQVVYQRAPFTGAVISQTNPDGGNPFAAPVIGWDGKLHAWVGSWGPQQGGALVGFAIDGTTTVDQTFAQVTPTINADNAAMQALTVSGRDGRIFGVRPFGGAHNAGVVFRTERDGGGYTELFSFDDASAATAPHYANATGAVPIGTLYEDLDGTLVGTTFYGGSHGTGVVWRIGRDGTGFRVLAEFDNTVGCYPAAGVIRVGTGLIGTATQCGSTGGGTIYRLEAST